MNTKVVPVEPTDAMVNAMLHEITARFPHNWTAQSVYRAALAAAPPQPEPANPLKMFGPTCGGFADSREREIIAAATALVPFLEMGWDEMDEPEDQALANAACDRLVTAVKQSDKESTERLWQVAPTAAEAVGKPDAHLREQIADAQARQAKGEGIPGDAELAHYDEATIKAREHTAPDSTLPLSADSIEYRLKWLNERIHKDELANIHDGVKHGYRGALNQALRAIELEHKYNAISADYQRIIREVLACNPLPARGRADDQLEPPWEVIKRVREQVAEKDIELKKWRKWNIVEIAVRNDQVAQYMTHWEDRTTKAEAELAELRARKS